METVRAEGWRCVGRRGMRSRRLRGLVACLEAGNAKKWFLRLMRYDGHNRVLMVKIGVKRTLIEVEQRGSTSGLIFVGKSLV